MRVIVGLMHEKLQSAVASAGVGIAAAMNSHQRGRSITVETTAPIADCVSLAATCAGNRSGFRERTTIASDRIFAVN